MPHTGDPGIDLGSRELPTLPRLGALGDLDLEIGGVDQVFAGNSEAARSYLFNRAAAPVAVGVAQVAGRVLAPLAGVGAGVDPVHGDSQGLVRLAADGAVGHGAGGEAPEDR